MAVGDLSSDQKRFVDRVAANTGLDPKVVTAWVGTESGWNTNKPGGNYLNIGPGTTYASTDSAADAVASLIKGSSYYDGIVSSVAQGPGAQISAIGSSKWGTSAKTLDDVFKDLTGISVTPGVGSTETPAAVAVGLKDDLASAGSTLVSQALEGIISIVFVTASVALIGFGLARITESPTGKVKSAGGIADQVGTVAQFAPGPIGATGKGLKTAGSVAKAF